MIYELGFIGAGNICRAVLGGVLRAGLFEAGELVVADIDRGRLDAVALDFGVKTGCNMEVAKSCRMLVLSVAPQDYGLVIEQIKGAVRDDVIVVTVAAGRSVEQIVGAFGRPVKVARTMPNTPCLANAGMTGVCGSDNLTEGDLARVMTIFESIGKVAALPEARFDAFASVSGSSVAFVFMLLEALGDAGVVRGFSKVQALEYAAQAILGAVTLFNETGEHPAILRDAVCTPGGSTIEGVLELERLAFRHAVVAAVDNCVWKLERISKESKDGI